MGRKKINRAEDVVTRDYTINLHKRLHRITYKKKAPKAIRNIRKFAKQMMGTDDVRIDVTLNKFIGAKVSEMFLTVVAFDSLENVMKMKNQQKNCIHMCHTLIPLVNLEIIPMEKGCKPEL